MAENITKATEASVESYLSGIEDEADMPAGRARMAYWPEEGGGFHWVVEKDEERLESLRGPQLPSGPPHKRMKPTRHGQGRASRLIRACDP